MAIRAVDNATAEATQRHSDRLGDRPLNPGLHVWTPQTVEAISYACRSVPAETKLAEFLTAMTPGEDCRDSVVKILSGQVIQAPAKVKGAK